jgi:hypothetical protein
LLETEAETFVGVGMGLSETLREDLEFRGGFDVGDAGLEAGGDNDPMIVAGTEMACIGKELIDVADRHPELRVEEKIEAPEKRRSDADNSVRMAGERDGFAKDVGIGIEAGFPDAIAEDDDGRTLFVGTETTAEGQLEFSDIEEVGGGGLTPEALRIAVTGDGRGEKFVKAGDARKRLGIVADIGEKRPGKGVAAFVLVGSVESHEGGRIADGSGMEDKAADHGEGSGIGADAEGESQDDDGGEGRFVAKKTCGVAEIAE